MNSHSRPAASKLHELPPSGPACAPNEARRQANPNSDSNRRAVDAATIAPGQPTDRSARGNQNAGAIGASAANPVAAKASDGGADTPNPSTHRYGPLTTSRMDGCGGPHNPWDAKIAAAHRRGNSQLAARLQEARARVNLSFGHQEPVWIPTEHQRVMLGLRVCPTGLRVMDAKVAA